MASLFGAKPPAPAPSTVVQAAMKKPRAIVPLQQPSGNSGVVQASADKLG